MKENRSSFKLKGDPIIWMVFFFLCIVSVVEVFSASSNLTYKSGSYIGPVMKHVGLLALGVVTMVLTINIQCKWYKVAGPFMLFVSLVMLVVVLFVGGQINGSSRWLSLGGMQFQPSEFAKGTMVMITAQILSAMQTDNGAHPKAFWQIIIVSAFIVPLIMVENLSTAMLLCLVLVMMMFIGRVPKRQIGNLLGVAAILVVAVISLVMLVGHDKSQEGKDERLAKTEQLETMDGRKEDKGMAFSLLHRADTWKSRIDKFLNSEDVAPEDYDLDKDAQVAHANIAIASSSVVGKGPGNSVERDFLSQAFSDFIYAIIIEEIGLPGAAAVLMLYIILLFRTATIANRCQYSYPAFLVMGLALLLVTQAMFNMGVAVGLFPVTGQPLPLISKEARRR